MSWFTKFCHNAGLMVHHVIDPDDQRPRRQVLSKRVEQKQVSPTVTLRRTTIEELEVKAGPVDQDKKTDGDATNERS